MSPAYVVGVGMVQNKEGETKLGTNTLLHHIQTAETRRFIAAYCSDLQPIIAADRKRIKRSHAKTVSLPLPTVSERPEAAYDR